MTARTIIILGSTIPVLLLTAIGGAISTLFSYEMAFSNPAYATIFLKSLACWMGYGIYLSIFASTIALAAAGNSSKGMRFASQMNPWGFFLCVVWALAFSMFIVPWLASNQLGVGVIWLRVLVSVVVSFIIQRLFGQIGFRLLVASVEAINRGNLHIRK